MALNFIHSYLEFLSSNSLLNLIYFLFFSLHHPHQVFAHLPFDLRSLCLVSLFCEIPILSLTNPPINLSLEKNCLVLGTPLFKRKKCSYLPFFTNSTFLRLYSKISTSLAFICFFQLEFFYLNILFEIYSLSLEDVLFFFPSEKMKRSIHTVSIFIT